MTDITFRTVWRQQEPEAIRDAQGFWRGLGVLSPEEIDGRVNELCAVAYVDGELAAASTIVLLEFPPLRSRFAYYRTIVAPHFRKQRLASRLCVYSHDRLAEWAREHPEEKIKGLLIALEAEEFRHVRRMPVWKVLELHLIFMGYTPNGYQRRIVWFPDVTVE